MRPPFTGFSVQKIWIWCQGHCVIWPKMRVRKGEVVIYDASGVSRCPLWSLTLIRLLSTAEQTGSHVFHPLFVRI